MNTKRIIFIISISFLLIISREVSANSFSCEGKLILIGDTRYEVLYRCGNPDFKDIRFERRIKRDFFREAFLRTELDWYPERELYQEPLFVVEEVVIEEWTYNFGPTKLLRYLTFRNGRLINIQIGNYGF